MLKLLAIEYKKKASDNQTLFDLFLFLKGFLQSPGQLVRARGLFKPATDSAKAFYEFVCISAFGQAGNALQIPVTTAVKGDV